MSDTRVRVLTAAKELSYRPNLTARSLRSGRTNSIGLIIPELSLSYFAELADLVLRAADKRGLSVLIEQTNGERSRELQTISSPRMTLTDGVIFSPLGMGMEDAEALDVSYPLVILGERVFGGPTDHVTMRNVEAAHAATRFLLQSGRTRIAVLGAHPDEKVGSAALRLEGYRAALAEAGIPFDPQLVVETTLWHRSNGASAMHELLQRRCDFDAVFGLNDTLALGGMRVLQESGRRVPADVSVIGFDNLDEAAYSLPTLTTIEPGRSEIAEVAVASLVERMSGMTSNPREFRTEFSIVERESAPGSALRH